MKKIGFTHLLTIAFLPLLLEGASNPSSQPQTARDLQTEQKYQILKRDQVDPTSTYAIPLDDSEVEDEEEIERAERKKVNPLPNAWEGRKGKTQ